MDEAALEIEKLALEFVKTLVSENKIKPLVLNFNLQQAVTRTYELNPQVYSRTWAVMAMVHKNILSGGILTQRELYYLLKPLFKNQTLLNNTLVDITAITHCPRSGLGIIADPRGFVSGNLIFQMNDREIDLNKALISIIPSETVFGGIQFRIPSNGNPIQQIPQVILIIEKEAAFSRLVHEDFCKRFPVILITGRGNPDLATRAFASFLHNQLNLPIFILVDCDPGGIQVISTYALVGKGNKRIEASQFVVPDIQWIGLFPSQIDSLNIPLNSRMKLTEFDKKRLKDFLRSENEFLSIQTRNEIEILWSNAGMKVELDSLSINDFSNCSFSNIISELLFHQTTIPFLASPQHT